MEPVAATFAEIAAMSELVEHHEFSSGEDSGPFFNFTFGTPHALLLWQTIQARLYQSEQLGPHMMRCSIAMCSSEEGWDDYLLLFHFEPAVNLDSSNSL